MHPIAADRTKTSFVAQSFSSRGRHLSPRRRATDLEPLLPPDQRLEDSRVPPVAISPDGTTLVYVVSAARGRTQLYRRPLDSYDATVVDGTDGATAPFFFARRPLARILRGRSATTRLDVRAQTLPGEVKAKAKTVPGVSDAWVDVVWEPTWDMSKMSDAAKLQVGLL